MSLAPDAKEVESSSAITSAVAASEEAELFTAETVSSASGVRATKSTQLETDTDTADGTPLEDDIPIELQLEEVNMDDPDLDMLEWAVRKVIAIPRRYYWETGNYDLSPKTKAWHRIVGFLGTLVRVTDRVGKPVTDGMGLTKSRFDYVTSTMTEEDWEQAKITASERKLRQQRVIAHAEAEGDICADERVI